MVSEYWRECIVGRLGSDKVERWVGEEGGLMNVFAMDYFDQNIFRDRFGEFDGPKRTLFRFFF